MILLRTFFATLLLGTFAGPPSSDQTLPGSQPALHINGQGRVGLTYGYGDSILYVVSKDGGKTLSSSQLVARLPKLMAGMSRGPQISAVSGYTIITATTSDGDVYAYRLDHALNTWSPAIKINDVDTVAKEGFTAVAASGNKVLAVWLDLRSNRKNKIYGSWSNNGGKSWEKNVLVYQSPEGTICECCKLSATADAQGRFYVMFRNFLKGSRDLHLVTSLDGKSFGTPQKLGKGTWPLQGCPMDGGDLSVDAQGNLLTVWRRQKELFSVRPGQEEKPLGEGRTPTVAQNSYGTFLSWQRNGEVVVSTPKNPAPKVLGKGAYPQVRAFQHEDAALCVWENEGKIILRRVE